MASLPALITLRRIRGTTSRKAICFLSYLSLCNCSNSISMISLVELGTIRIILAATTKKITYMSEYEFQMTSSTEEIWFWSYCRASSSSPLLIPFTIVSHQTMFLVLYIVWKVMKKSNGEFLKTLDSIYLLQREPISHFDCPLNDLIQLTDILSLTFNGDCGDG